MKRIMAVLAGLCAALAFSASAAEYGTIDEAKALVRKAVAYYDKNGADKSFDEFSKSPGPFVDRDLYVVVYDLKGLALAHPNPKWRGKNMIDVRDQSGHNWVKERSELALKQPSGLQDTQIFNPLTKKVEPKRVYWERHGNFVFCSGAYIK